MHVQRQRPCFENASLCCCACGLRRSASSIDDAVSRRPLHAQLSGETAAAALFCRFIDIVEFCPNGKMQVYSVKVGRMVCGKKTKGEGWLLELKVDIFGYDNVNVIWSSRG